MKEKSDVVKEVKGYRNVIIGKPSDPQKRLMVGIPMVHSVRAEWVLARYGQVIPCNWSQNDHIEWVDQHSPLRFTVANARNIIADHFVKQGCEWLIFIDHDVVLPPLFLVRMNEYMIKAKIPILSGLYFTKSVPSEPLIYRGRGNGYYSDWKFGDKVWVDGLPMGCTAIHHSILETMWEKSEEYNVGSLKVRKVFETPLRVFFDPETQSFNTQTGTEDLEFCSRIMREGIFEKAGWPQYQKKKNPFLIDTRLFCRHIDEAGVQYPSRGEYLQFVKKKKKKK